MPIFSYTLTEANWKVTDLTKNAEKTVITRTCRGDHKIQRWT